MTINKHTKETDRKMFSFLMKSCSATVLSYIVYCLVIDVLEEKKRRKQEEQNSETFQEAFDNYSFGDFPEE